MPHPDRRALDSRRNTPAVKPVNENVQEPPVCAEALDMILSNQVSILRMITYALSKKNGAMFAAFGLSIALVVSAPTTAFSDPLSAGQLGLIDSADPARAEAKSKKCAKCHGENGVSDDPEVPHLAGQTPSYLLKQLIDFKEDSREGGRMNKTARKLDDQEMADLAVHFANTALPAAGPATVPAEPAQVAAGDAPCADCHGADGKGRRDRYDAPALAGMPFDYFVTSMQGFRDGGRSNDADAVMRDAAKPLSDAQIADLAAYYLALGQRKRLPPP